MAPGPVTTSEMAIASARSTLERGSVRICGTARESARRSTAKSAAACVQAPANSRTATAISKIARTRTRTSGLETVLHAPYASSAASAIRMMVAANGERKRISGKRDSMSNSIQ